MNRVMIYKKSKKNKNKNQFIGINKINSNESFSRKKKKNIQWKQLIKALGNIRGKQL